MSEQNQPTANESNAVNDLNVGADTADEVKGGLQSVVLPWIAPSRGALALPDLEAQGEVKGGPGGYGSGGVLMNHNETAVEDEESEPETLADLPVEEAEQIKGGPGWCTQCGGIYSNHNETVDDDDSEADDDLLQFVDLALTDEQLAEVKGGPGSGWCTQCGGIYSNHNETVDSDNEYDAQEIDSLDDLSLEPATENTITGGPGGYGSGGILINHNETTVSDEAAEPQESAATEAKAETCLPDLEAQNNIKGGQMLEAGRVRVSSSSGFSS